MTPLNKLERAILETLAYSDIFEYPLLIEEVHRYLSIRATLDQTLNGLSRAKQADSRSGYYFLAGHDIYVDIRTQRAAASIPAFKRAVRYGRILGSMPFVRMVGMTGSLAVMNLSKGADIDYMLVTQPGRLWMARAFAVTFGRMMRPFGHRICVNLLVSESALLWPIHDLYSAREMCQMIPITGMDVYRRLCTANTWIESILPNASLESSGLQLKVHEPASALQKLLELPLRGEYSDWLERWCMKSQLHRIARRGSSDETNFTVDVCQSNFHSHRKWAHEVFQDKLNRLNLQLEPRRMGEREERIKESV